MLIILGAEYSNKEKESEIAMAMVIWYLYWRSFSDTSMDGIFNYFCEREKNEEKDCCVLLKEFPVGE